MYLKGNLKEICQLKEIYIGKFEIIIQKYKYIENLKQFKIIRYYIIDYQKQINMAIKN